MSDGNDQEIVRDLVFEMMERRHKCDTKENRKKWQIQKSSQNSSLTEISLKSRPESCTKKVIAL